MSIYINRTLNMKSIKALGFDMDFTLVRYNSHEFELETFKEVIKKLIHHKNYPKILNKLEFDFNRAIRGLVIDKRFGNIIKLNNFGKIKSSYHGGRPLSFKDQKKHYRYHYVDLNDPNYRSVDTYFSIAHTVLYSQLVDLKDSQPEGALPSYEEIERDVMELVDLSHRDGSVKGLVKKDLKRFIIQEPECVEVLENFKRYRKKLWVITNSDFEYTKLLLDHTINPFLKDHKHWSELFDLVITSACKPRFFTDNLPFLKIDLKTGHMKNPDEKIVHGIYQGGCSSTLQADSEIHGDEILYLGDHIYGDILSLKKACNWRTALVIEELADEVKALHKTRPSLKIIDQLMSQKIAHEREIDQLYAQQYKKHNHSNQQSIDEQFNFIKEIDQKLQSLITDLQHEFNPYWGEIMRSGAEPSRFAGQVEKYACIYMSKISDFHDYSPRFYYRPKKRRLAHEY